MLKMARSPYARALAEALGTQFRVQEDLANGALTVSAPELDQHVFYEVTNGAGRIPTARTAVHVTKESLIALPDDGTVLTSVGSGALTAADVAFDIRRAYGL